MTRQPTPTSPATVTSRPASAIRSAIMRAWSRLSIWQGPAITANGLPVAISISPGETAMKQLIWSFVLFLFSALNAAGAEVLVLVHGYLGSAQSWAEAGVLDRLQRRGYRPVAMYGYSAGGVLVDPVLRIRLYRESALAIMAGV